MSGMQTPAGPLRAAGGKLLINGDRSQEVGKLRDDTAGLFLYFSVLKSSFRTSSIC